MSWNNIIPFELLEIELEQKKALDIIAQVLKDRKAWGEAAGIRVAQWELVNALLALESKIFRDDADIVTKDELTTEKRRYNAMHAQYEKALKDSARMRAERDEALKQVRSQNIGKVSK